MAVFTPVSEAEASAFIAPLAIGKLVSLRGIPSGIENTNYFVTTTAGEFVLTLFERLCEKQLSFSLQLMGHLAQRGIPVPAPRGDDAGRIVFALNGCAFSVAPPPSAAVAVPRGSRSGENTALMA